MKSKLLKRDYNQELEEIAESKRFEKEAQNLLLSMLYKIDGAYNDYEEVKREVPYKEEYLENILKTVKKYCNEIEIAKPNSLLEKELESSKCKIQELENKKVIIFPNEKKVLYNIIKAGIEPIEKELSIEDKAILTAIQIGKCIAYSEVIRDFNGFSWTSVINEIENIECNCIYTDLSYLIGEENVCSFNSSNISKLKEYISKELYEEIKKVAIKFYLYSNEEEKNIYENKIVRCKEQLNKMEKQDNFVEDITKNKKGMLSRIKEIDEALNNSELLRKKYIEKNSTLPNEQKIFSMSHYEEILQKERMYLLKEIENNNKILKPSEFVKIKTELEKEVKFYEELKNIDVVKMQEEFFKSFKDLLKNKNEKIHLLDYIYEIRYLKYLPISKKEKMKEKIDFIQLEKETIAKAIKNGIITPISNNEETDYILLKSLFCTRSVNLEEFSIMLTVEEGKLKAQIYDGEMIDSTNIVDLGRNSNIQIRKTKKVKIFN